jgi:hypothetical protein
MDVCRYPVAGIPTSTAPRHTSHSHLRLRHKGRNCRAPRVGLLPHRANGPRPAPSSGTGPVTPRVPEKGTLSQKQLGDPDLPRGPGPHILSGPLSREGTDTPPGMVRNRHVSADAGTLAAAKLPREDLPTYRVQCGRR